MKRIVPFFIILLLLLTLWIAEGVGAPTQAPSQARGNAVEKLKPSLASKIRKKGRHHVIVHLESADEPFAQLVGKKARTPTARDERRKAIRRLQKRFVDNLGPRFYVPFQTIPYIALEVDASELERLTGLPDVLSIHEDTLLRPLLDVSVPQIGGDLAWSLGYTGNGQIIAILDSGVDSSHGALAGKVVDEACFSSNSALEGASSLCPSGAEEEVGGGAGINCDGILGCDHGTHVAGIAAAEDSQYTGVAREADIMAVQVFSRVDNLFACGFFPPCLAAFTSDVIRGLEYVYNQRDNFDIAAVNMSLGGESYSSPQECENNYPALKAAIDNLRAVGIATVVASGNDGYTDAISSPACISTAISVGAVTSSDGVAYFSNVSPWLKTLAPGAGIVSTVPGGGFASKDGTSMAAPHVAGAVAVLNSVAPDALVEEIEEALTSTGVPVTDARNGVVIPRVQVDAAAQALNELYDITNITLDLEQILTGLDRPVAVTHAGDGSGRLFIGQQPGQIMVYDGATLLSNPFLDISQRVYPVSPGGREGLLSVAFHPQYTTNGFFYVSYIDYVRDMVVARYTVASQDANVADGASEQVLLTVSAPPGDHYGGQLAFGPDGYLYISIGDGGEDDVVTNTARDLGSLLGKILRINVDAGTPYAIPPDNPYLNDPQAADEIWALGLRNPWRFSFDRLTGDLYIADVGEATYEEVNYQAASSAGGEDYGWNVMEGSACYGGPGCDPAGLVLPLAEYDHTEGCAITGGQVYRGVRYAVLRGVYMYADFCSGRIWGLKRNGTEWQSALLLDTGPANISTFGEDEAGNVYLADHAPGNLYLIKTRFSITTTDLPEGRVGEAYASTLRASGGKRPYIWSLHAGSLPDGLTLDAGTGVISGMPTTEELSTFTIRVEDSNLENATLDLEIQIYPPPPAIQTLSLPDAPVDESYSQTLQASGGRPPYTWAIASGALPPGINLNPDGTMAGTPIDQGYYTFEVQVSDETDGKDSRMLSIAVVGLSGTIEIDLEEGVTDGGQYGYNYGGSLHETQLIVTFVSTGTDLNLSVTGYDIDFTDEVAVYLNGTLLGFLSPGPNDGLNGGDSFCIRVRDQLGGENQLKFVQKTAGFTWGVTNLLVAQDSGSGICSPEVTLAVGVTDSAPYGYNYGSSLHETELIATFVGTTTDLVFSVTGYDIDSMDEVAVFLNGSLLGYLSPGPNNGLNGGDSFCIRVRDQLNGENLLKFVQKVAGNTWGVTNLLVAQDSGSGICPPEVTLTVGVTDSGQYGYNYGSSLHETELIATFVGTTTDLVFLVSGYDIDSSDEVAVYLNGALLGYLSPGPNNGLSSRDSFSISVDKQLSGENLLKFVQKVAGNTWGVTNLLVAQDSGSSICPPSAALAVGVIDSGQYGYNYGSSLHETQLNATFVGTTTDLVFSVTGYDIDSMDEVAVYLNGSLLGYLSPGPNDGLNGGDSFCIRVRDQLNGENLLKFVQKVAGNTWGVTDLLVAQDSGSGICSPEVALAVGVIDSGQYGYNYGSSLHETELIATFVGTTTDLVFSVTGYDIDSTDEVAVYLNGTLLGYLSQGLDNGLNGGDSFSIPVDKQLSGENLLKFVQKVAGNTWGVTDLLVEEQTGSDGPPEVTLTVGVTDSGQYGYNYGSSLHETELIATFVGTTTDLVFSVTGYDIDFTDEVALYLNGTLMGYLSQGPNNGLNSGDSFCIQVGDQLIGKNRLKFVQKTAGWKWGVTNLLVAQDSGSGICPPEVTLTVGVTDSGQYGYNYGSSFHETELIATFVGTTTDLVFSVTGYDIDFTDEVALYLNGLRLDHLSQGPNDGLNSGDSFCIRVNDQLSGVNRLKFVQKTAGFTWGVTNLLLE